MKILTVIGARPQFIKAATVSRKIREKYSSRMQEVLVHTGQHFDANMSDIFFEELQIPAPNYNLEINSGSHGAMTGRMLEKIEDVLKIEKPDCVLVYGDTNSTIAGALAAVKLHIPVAHVEAGLRSFNKAMPEEVNRILTDRISDILFCPTETAVENLKSEGVNESLIMNVGDVMFDSILYFKKSAKPSVSVAALIDSAKPYVLVTLHRAENTDSPERLANIFKAFEIISKEHQLILPLHPRTKKVVQDRKIDLSHMNIIDPVGYIDMVCLLRDSSLVMTDSGGLQKEAYFMDKPTLTLRSETEWVELVNVGANVICDDNVDKIISEFKKNFGRAMPSGVELYGNGDSADKIVSSIVDRF